MYARRLGDCGRAACDFGTVNNGCRERAHLSGSIDCSATIQYITSCRVIEAVSRPELIHDPLLSFLSSEDIDIALTLVPVASRGRFNQDHWCRVDEELKATTKSEKETKETYLSCQVR